MSVSLPIKAYVAVSFCFFLAKLVIADRGNAITLRTKNILIQNNGELHIGSESSPHTSPLEILLYGRSSDPEQHPIFGNKYIGVMATGTLEIHGPWKRSWTLLQTTLQPGTNCKEVRFTTIAILLLICFISDLKFRISPFLKSVAPQTSLVAFTD